MHLNSIYIMYYFISFYDWIQQFYIAVFTQSVIYQIQYRFLLQRVDFVIIKLIQLYNSKTVQIKHIA